MRTLSIAFIGGIVGSVFSAFLVIAWTGPGSSPPNNNVSPPVNVGSTDQVKDAGLALNSLAVFGNTILSGASRYLNFGTISGTAGYGIRDNAGTMEVKDASGDWVEISADSQIGTLTNGRWCTTDGSTINCTSTEPGGGMSAVTTVSCTHMGSGCTATCSSSYYRTGCSGSATHISPSGSRGCSSSGAGAVYAYCAR